MRTASVRSQCLRASVTSSRVGRMRRWFAELLTSQNLTSLHFTRREPITPRSKLTRFQRKDPIDYLKSATRTPPHHLRSRLHWKTSRPLSSLSLSLKIHLSNNYPIPMAFKSLCIWTRFLATILEALASSYNRRFVRGLFLCDITETRSFLTQDERYPEIYDEINEGELITAVFRQLL
jgi:hypothetical protein